MVEPNETHAAGTISIHTVNAYNSTEGSSTVKQHKQGVGVGYILEINGTRIYHAGDTDVIPDMKKIGKIDIAMLPIGGTFTMNPKEAIEAIEIIKPTIVIPMHNLAQSLHTFAKKVEKETKAKAVVMEIGEKFLFKK